MSINGLSFASARPTPQPCVSVFMAQEIQELHFLTIPSHVGIQETSYHLFHYASLHSAEYLTLQGPTVIKANLLLSSDELLGEVQYGEIGR